MNSIYLQCHGEISGTLASVRIIGQGVRIIGQSEVEKVKASGSLAEMSGS